MSTLDVESSENVFKVPQYISFQLRRPKTQIFNKIRPESSVQSQARATKKNLGHSLHEKGFTKKNKRRYTGQQPGTKSASRPAYEPVIKTADKPVVNRGSTASFVSPPVYIEIPLFVLAQRCAKAYQACRGDGL